MRSRGAAGADVERGGELTQGPCRFVARGEFGEEPARLLQLERRPAPAAGQTPADLVAEAQQLIDQGKFDAVVYFEELSATRAE